MKKIMILMTIFMGITMSLVLSTVGTLIGGHFSIQSWLMSLCISLVLSLIIGFVIPVKKISDTACQKKNLIPESPKGHFLGALISNCIYTPFLTIVMTATMVILATKEIPAWQPRLNILIHALIPSLIVCFIVGYIVILVVQPIFIKLLTKNLKQGPAEQ